LPPCFAARNGTAKNKIVFSFFPALLLPFGKPEIAFVFPRASRGVYFFPALRAGYSFFLFPGLALPVASRKLYFCFPALPVAFCSLWQAEKYICVSPRGYCFFLLSWPAIQPEPASQLTSQPASQLINQPQPAS